MRTCVGILVFLLGCDGSISDDDASTTTDATSNSTLDAPADVTVDVDVEAEAATDAGVVDATTPEAATKDATSDETSAPPDVSACTYAEAGGGYCNTLPVSNTVYVACVASLPPTENGGTIVDGLYELTAATIYANGNDGGCSQNQTRRDTIEICGNVMLWRDVDTVNSTYDGNNTFTTSNNTLTITHFCSGGAPPMPYTATSTSLTVELDYPNNGPALVLTLARQ